VKEIVEEDPDLVNAMLVQEKRPLHVTLGHPSQLGVASYLIAKGADVNAKWEDCTPLYRSCRDCQHEAVNQFEKGAIPIITNSHGVTPLAAACGALRHFSTMVALLLRNG